MASKKKQPPCCGGGSLYGHELFCDVGIYKKQKLDGEVVEAAKDLAEETKSHGLNVDTRGDWIFLFDKLIEAVRALKG